MQPVHVFANALLSRLHVLTNRAHLGRYNQHSCVAEAYKTRGRAFQGRELRHLVTSKAGCNQASGSFLSAVSCSRYAGGCMVGGLSRLLAELMTKTLFGLFLHRAACWSKDSQAHSLTAGKRFLITRGFFDRLYVWHFLFFFSLSLFSKRDAVLYCQREIYFSPWPVSHSSNCNKGAIKTVIKLNWKHRYDFRKRYIVHLVCSARVLVWVFACISMCKAYVFTYSSPTGCFLSTS